MYCGYNESHQCENEVGIRHFINKRGEIQGCAGCCPGCLSKDTCEYACAYVKPKDKRPTPSAQCLDAATAAESQTAASPAVPEVSSPTTETAPAAQNAAAPVSASEKNAALFAGSDSSLSNPTAPGFDYSQFDEQTAQALQNFAFRALQVARTYFMKIVVGAHKLLCGTIVHDVDNGKFAPKEDTFRAWCASVHISKSKAYQLLQIQSFMDTCTPEEQSTLALLPFTAMRELVTGDTPEQVITMAKEGKVGTSKEVLELKAQLKAEKARADTAEHQLEAAQADVAGLTEQNGQLLTQQNSYIININALQKQNSQLEHRAKDAESQLSGARQVAEAAKLRGDKLKAENDALKKQPIATVVDKDEVRLQAEALARQRDEEEIDRLAAEKAWGLADARNSELQADKDKLAKDNAAMQKQLRSQTLQLNAMRSQLNDLAQADFEIANNFPVQLWAAWNASKGSYSHLSGDDLEDTFKAICSALDGVKEEAARLYRQPADYDGGADDEPDV